MSDKSRNKTLDTFPPPPKAVRQTPRDTEPPFDVDPNAVDSELEPGVLLEGKYRITYVLGKGTMGTVYLARDETLNREVAIKVLSSRLQREKKVLERFRKEAVAMARVHHPNVVQVFTLGSHRGLPFFVMEYIKGESLADLIERTAAKGGLLHVDEVLGIMDQVCRGVEAIHAEGIAHRDLKPANILLDKNYRVAVTDFGLVRPLEKKAGTEQPILDGTPMYLAPERIEDAGLGDVPEHLSDIYALGAIFYELLTTLPPYEFDDVLSVLDAHLSQPPPSALAVRPDLPPVVDRIIAKAMAKDPRERYGSCREMLGDLWAVRPRGWSGAVSGPPETGGTIVLTDTDSETLAAMVRSVRFAYPDATVLTAMDGATALRLIKDMKPDLVILDEETPELNALEVCTRLLDVPAGHARPIVIVTAKRLDPLRRKLFKEVGAADVISKSSVATELLDVVAEALERALGEDRG